MFTHFEQTGLHFALLFAFLCIVIFLRYLLTAAFYHYFVLRFFQKRHSNRVLQTKALPARQVRFEILRSALSSIIFAAFALALFWLYLNDYTALYHQWSDHPLWYAPLSILLFLLLQDTYYYWLHRWMHHPKLFRRLHKWHHESVQTSSLTSFSFNPSESILQSLFFPAFLLLVPIHIYSFFLILLLMTLSATINHGAVEIYPKTENFRWFRYWIIGATHHDQHQKKYN
ncbi:MAG: sterol desaturase family protein [Bacteroidota bacterium]